jgi:hypothetical protein
MPVTKTCAHCASTFTVPKNRETSAKFCGRACYDAAPRPQAHTVNCVECGKEIQRKPSKAKKAVWGHFCGEVCVARARSRKTSGAGNPNYKGRVFDYDGYRIYAPSASLALGFPKNTKVHQAEAMLAFGVKALPRGTHVHHRDGDVLNNAPENLQLMTTSDHKWLHRQYGTVLLKAFVTHGIEADWMVDLSDDPIKARWLLGNSLPAQASAYRLLVQQYGAYDLMAFVAAKPCKTTLELVGVK